MKRLFIVCENAIETDDDCEREHMMMKKTRGIIVIISITTMNVIMMSCIVSNIYNSRIKNGYFGKLSSFLMNTH